MEEKDTTKKGEVALREEAILEFWKKNKTFEKSLDRESPKGCYVFYDGPPFATGQMHYGHILGSTAKDVIGRYKTMQGFHVPRKWGWDCHGLPIENIVEKELGIAGHKEIEEHGINKFVEYARSKVLQYDKDWEKGIERIGRWVDFRGSYKTMDNDFIESVWWALSEFNKKNLIYEGVKVLAYCARCETPIANSEIAMDNSYKDISDISVYVKFELESEPKTYLLAWTTTPWTLPGNTAIAVNKRIDYIKIKVREDFLILAKDTLPVLQNVFKDQAYTILGEMKGEELIGKKYKPVFSYYQNDEVGKSENIWRVWHADFVTIEKGTGIAHEAPAFGEDDMNLAKRENIPWIIHVDETGRFKEEVTDFAGMQVKPKGEEKDAHQKADIEVIKYLAKNGTLFAKEKIIHPYPHCMRCDTPIIYYALPSWFINIQKVKKNIKKQAEKMNWIPSHLKEGRFKNIVENAPDWNISRNRYWASPLPIWKCQKCHKKVFVNSLEDLKNKTRKSGNQYFVVRHGEAMSNKNKVIDSKGDPNNKLTAWGVQTLKENIEEYQNIDFDLIFCSPMIRTKQTADILADLLGFGENQIITDKRLTEFQVGDLDGKNGKEYEKYMKTVLDHLSTPTPNGESRLSVYRRMGDFIYELERRYLDKKILIISHGDPILALFLSAKGYKKDQIKEEEKNFKYFRTGDIRELSFIPIPHNENYELDLHRPYIDHISLDCECGGELIRVPEVLDCWFESGSMPFAQDHYPFKNKKWQENNFPAGFVAEYIAQTRTWFYYTHAVSTVLFDQAPFENIVTTGTLRAEDGEKMSKSKNNYPDPWIFIDKYGVDALRLYLMSSTLMKGEDANFSEKSVQEISSKIIGRLSNVLSFYELYKDRALEINGEPQSDDVLDRWILLRLRQMMDEITDGMEGYDMSEATKPVDLFVDDLSTWYLRRSRDRIKDGDKDAKQILYFVLKNMAKMLAPFAPFIAEDIWLKLKTKEDAESVHLCEWPKIHLTPWPLSLLRRGGGERSILENMRIVRKIVTLGLEARQKEGVRVRQPLAKLEVKNTSLNAGYLALIKDELNVKEVKQNKHLWIDVMLDTEMTPELRQEGDYRELVRALQDMRKNMGLTPSDAVSMVCDTSNEGKALIQKFEKDMKKTVLVTKIEFKVNDGGEIKIDEMVFKVKIEK